MIISALFTIKDNHKMNRINELCKLLYLARVIWNDSKGLKNNRCRRNTDKCGYLGISVCLAEIMPGKRDKKTAEGRE